MAAGIAALLLLQLALPAASVCLSVLQLVPTLGTVTPATKLSSVHLKTTSAATAKGRALGCAANSWAAVVSLSSLFAFGDSLWDCRQHLF